MPKYRLLKSSEKKRIETSVAEIIDHLTRIAFSDVNEIMQYRRNNCRHCWGLNFNYQWNEQVYNVKCSQALQRGEPAPDSSGGFGYSPTRPPNPECPVCGGEGHGRVYLADTRNLSENGKRLYAGVKENKLGVEILIKDQTRALENLAKILGAFKINYNITSDNKTLVNIDSDKIDSAQAAKIYLEQITGKN